MLTVDQVLKSVSDWGSLALFKSIASVGEGEDLSAMSLTKLKLSRRAYYSRLRQLLDTELVERTSGRYKLTSLGKIVYEYYMKIENLLEQDYYKLKAIDAIEKSDDLGLVERVEAINNLIEDKKLKAILVR
jgi:predicted transcriptional regulator